MLLPWLVDYDDSVLVSGLDAIKALETRDGGRTFGMGLLLFVWGYGCLCGWYIYEGGIICVLCMKMVRDLYKGRRRRSGER